MAAPEGYKTLGKIGISYKGDYNPNTVYERLDAVYHNGSTYLAIKDAPDGAPRDDKTNWIYLAKGYDGETVDVAESEIAFTDSETRENIVSGEKVSTVFGKIKKFFTDLTAPAFAQMITSADDLLATKVTGYVPDAKAVADVASELNRKLSGKLEIELLWENPNTGVDFEAQEIELPTLNKYSFYFIIFSGSTYGGGKTEGINTGFIPIDRATELMYIGSYLRWRGVTRSDKGIRIGQGNMVQAYGTSTKENSVCIPAEIYGVK